MTELSVNQKTFIKRMSEDEEYERRGFELLLKRPDFDGFFVLPLPERGDDSQRLLRYLLRQWLSAIAGQGSDAADKWFHELMSDPSLGGLSPQPDFHSYMESHWGFGPTPHTVQDLIAFAETGTVVDKLNEFAQIDKWDGPSTRSLSDSVVEAVGLAPKTLLALLPSFLNAKREYQYAVIAGFKKFCKPTRAWRPVLPVRASASISPAITVRPSASSSSRYASSPASEVTTDPRNWSVNLRSKSSLRTPSVDSPVGFSMASSEPN
jgi:hypothetical protein